MSRRDQRRNINRRHVDLDVRPLRRQRRTLNRMAFSIATLFALIVAGTLILPDLLGEDAPIEADPGDGALSVSHPVEGAIAVEVLRIIDGDTLEIRSAETDLTVRLYGVDTPERGEACYEEATARLGNLAGSVVQLLPDARTTDRFGRELRYVYASDGTLIDEVLVTEGYGRAWTDDGSLRAQIVAAEAEARADARGCLWSE